MRYSVAIASDTDAVMQIQEHFLGVAEQSVQGNPDRMAIMDALKHLFEEAAINMIKHGNGSDPTKKVFIDYGIENGEVELTLRDEGEGYDPTTVPDPTKPECIERPCGRGHLFYYHYTSKLGGSVEFLPVEAHSNLCNGVRFKVHLALESSDE